MGTGAPFCCGEGAVDVEGRLWSPKGGQSPQHTQAQELEGEGHWVLSPWSFGGKTSEEDNRGGGGEAYNRRAAPSYSPSPGRQVSTRMTPCTMKTPQTGREDPALTVVLGAVVRLKAGAGVGCVRSRGATLFIVTVGLGMLHHS